MRLLTYIFIMSIVLISCKHDTKLDADAIVDKSIEVSGGELIGNSTIQFAFRGKHYSAKRKNGLFTLSRTISKDSITILD